MTERASSLKNIFRTLKKENKSNKNAWLLFLMGHRKEVKTFGKPSVSKYELGNSCKNTMSKIFIIYSYKFKT